MRLLILSILLIVPLVGKGHGYWLDIKGSGKINQPVRIQICFGEIDQYSMRHRETGPELAEIGGFQVAVLDCKGKRTDLTLSPLSDCWEAVFTPDQKGIYQIVGIHTDLPVVDRSQSGGENIRPIDYLCAHYQVGETQTGETTCKAMPSQFLDIITWSKDKFVVIKAFKNHQPAANNTRLRIFNPENWEKNLVVNMQGEASFMPTQKGLYIIRQDWIDSTPGNYKGKSYTSVRHRCNYCLWVQ
ncbi:hypothetical protein [Xanthocytophaga flava]|uniref:hypothetical protein n=1 Tax=Xanthocytophaga flava TaxID=3048013 RepID=UPI0028D6B15F|nr:hypothetical protein [Xanthocytophaga flavus]MDJ1470323.1 hypothetical protein [Xanthocytophaga flavus]